MLSSYRMASIAPDNEFVYVNLPTAIGRELRDWRLALIADLGGLETLSTQQLALIDLMAERVQTLGGVALLDVMRVIERNRATAQRSPKRTHWTTR